MASLGQTYLTGGGGLARDEREAVRWFRQGAEKDDGRAMAMLGQMYLTGGGGSPHAMTRRVCSGCARRPRLETVLRWPRWAACARDGRGRTRERRCRSGALVSNGRPGRLADGRWHQLGRMYSEGRGGLAKNPAEAVRWYRAGSQVWPMHWRCSPLPRPRKPVLACQRIASKQSNGIGSRPGLVIQMPSTVSRISISDWCEGTASSRAKEAEPGRTGREGGREPRVHRTPLVRQCPACPELGARMR